MLAVLEQFVAAQKSMDWLYPSVAVICGGTAIFGLLQGQITWITGVAGFFAGAAVLSYWQQKKTIREVTFIVRRYADAQGYQIPTMESQLMTELRLHHPLNYQQQQQLKVGEVVDVAKEFVKATRRTGWGMLTMFSANGLMQLSLTLWKGAPLTSTNFLVGLGGFVMMAGFAIWQCQMHLVRAKRLEQLIGEHPAEIAALTLRVEIDTDTDTDSPYRPPEFH